MVRETFGKPEWLERSRTASWRSSRSTSRTSPSGSVVEAIRTRERERADVLVVNSDPLADIAVLQDRERLHLILKDGWAYKNLIK